MNIGQNIARYRRAKGLTQEELGSAVGVTNQAVSKWENGTTLPDTALLPDIAAVLGVTPNELYGIENEAKNKLTADEFPEAAYELLFRFFYDHCGCRFSYVDRSDEIQYPEWHRRIGEGCMLGCLSDTLGAVVITRGMAVVDRTFKQPESADIFASSQLARALKYLSDRNTCRVLAFQYRRSFEMECTEDVKFTLREICEGCSLTEDEAEDALERLTLLNLEEKYTDNSHDTVWYFEKSKALWPLVIFKAAAVLTGDDVWHVVRDSSMISDYAFL